MSGRSFGSGTAKHWPPLTVMSARLPSRPAGAGAARTHGDGIGDRSGARDGCQRRVEVRERSRVAQTVRGEDEELLRIGTCGELGECELQRCGVVGAVRVPVLRRVLRDVVVEAVVEERDGVDDRIPVGGAPSWSSPPPGVMSALTASLPKTTSPMWLTAPLAPAAVLSPGEERLLAREHRSAGPAGIAGAARGVEDVDNRRLRRPDADACSAGHRHVYRRAVGEELRPGGGAGDGDGELGAVRQRRAARARERG